MRSLSRSAVGRELSGVPATAPTLRQSGRFVSTGHVEPLPEQNFPARLAVIGDLGSLLEPQMPT